MKLSSIIQFFTIAQTILSAQDKTELPARKTNHHSSPSTDVEADTCLLRSNQHSLDPEKYESLDSFEESYKALLDAKTPMIDLEDDEAHVAQARIISQQLSQYQSQSKDSNANLRSIVNDLKHRTNKEHSLNLMKAKILVYEQGYVSPISRFTYINEAFNNACKEDEHFFDMLLILTHGVEDILIFLDSREFEMHNRKPQNTLGAFHITLSPNSNEFVRKISINAGEVAISTDTFKSFTDTLTTVFKHEKDHAKHNIINSDARVIYTKKTLYGNNQIGYTIADKDGNALNVNEFYNNKPQFKNISQEKLHSIISKCADEIDEANLKPEGNFLNDNEAFGPRIKARLNNEGTEEGVAEIVGALQARDLKRSPHCKIIYDNSFIQAEIERNKICQDQSIKI